MFEVLILSFAFVFGIAARQVNLPPLVGFLGLGLPSMRLAPALACLTTQARS
ncbi:hypothetical protein [Vreelandella lionensis]|uniref:hypothetical protein n=1 Tax=Vreelandella lionensis TaxID=1144478 RepID=UPI001FB3236C|nr:hypothetical protein [Halomonas lionensis]